MNNDLQIQRGTRSAGFSSASELTVELGKMLALVAPSSMTADQQEIWLCAAVDALQDIRGSEVREVSAEVRRTVTRHNQILPEISRLVAERRKRQAESARRARDDEEARLAIPVRKHVSERDRRQFGPADWEELNQWLEAQGAGARYRPDGTRYLVTA